MCSNLCNEVQGLGLAQPRTISLMKLKLLDHICFQAHHIIPDPVAAEVLSISLAWCRTETVMLFERFLQPYPTIPAQD